VLPTCLLFGCASPAVTCPPGAPAAPDRHAEIEAFNATVVDATRRMDDAATIATWEDDGVSLLPEAGPMVGKKAIAAFVTKLGADHPGAKMKSFEMQCTIVDASGDVASEWCTEHQVVELDAGKPPFEGWGKLLYVLHRGADAKWRVRVEMWNAGLAHPPAGGS
jgi:ketosteroid isomerase-like protein